MKPQELIDHIKENYMRHSVVVVGIFTPEDVRGLAVNDDVEASDKQCDAVVEAMEASYDANEGLNWEVMGIHLDSIAREG